MASTYECPVCGENLISGDAYVQAENGRKYHDYCFRCNICKTVLDTQPYYMAEDDTIYCKEDFFGKKLPKCGGCQKPIEDKEYEKFGDFCYHLEHMTCDSCRKPLTDRKVIVIGRKKLCYKDAQAEGVMFCQRCFEPIQDRFTKIADKTFHSTCVECHRCRQLLEGEKEVLEYQLEYYHTRCIDEEQIAEIRKANGADAVKKLKL